MGKIDGKGSEFSKMVTECFTEKVTFEQRSEGDGGSQPCGYLEKWCFIERKRWKRAWYVQKQQGGKCA